MGKNNFQQAIEISLILMKYTALGEIEILFD